MAEGGGARQRLVVWRTMICEFSHSEKLLVVGFEKLLGLRGARRDGEKPFEKLSTLSFSFPRSTARWMGVAV